MPPRNADQSDAYAIPDLLPDPLPTTPWGLFREWYDQARTQRVQPNTNAMTLATIDPDGTPSARIVLCKDMNLGDDAGYLVFHTNYHGRKGRALAAHPRCALVFHWDDLDKQVRIEGHAARSPEAESDAYFRTRALESRIGAWASQQSEPLDSREALMGRVAEVIQRFEVDLFSDREQVIPRPPHWGGFRVWARAVEVWVGGPGRVHDRARWERSLAPVPRGGGRGFDPGPWSRTRLQP